MIGRVIKVAKNTDESGGFSRAKRKDKREHTVLVTYKRPREPQKAEPAGEKANPQQGS